MSTSSLTIWAAVVAGLSIVLLVALDHRKPARRRRVAARGGVATGRFSPMVREVEHLPTQPYKRTPLWRRLLALTELGALGIVLGALLALALAVLVGGGFLLLDRAFK